MMRASTIYIYIHAVEKSFHDNMHLFAILQLQHELDQISKIPKFKVIIKL